ncbi:GGDEF domain-containing protein [Paenibacillus albidus]|uniref:sensor domain-containing diguanylate cyclase n=1 Tax=Paenibacillus albidus TaxID=2041023 RepID=UPI001BEB060D|nr:sensor domain-containing diguanylate cyclase [Paenibacillus albidus]MBT2292584.1 GGDEF domain-containing protein [Paenibacillus albidus]
MSLNLRTVFAGAFAVIIILLTVLISYVIGKQSTQSVEVSIGSSLSGVAYQMAEKLDHFMWSRAGEVEVLSKLNALQEPVDKVEISRLLDQLQESLPVFTWVGFLNSKGTILAATDNILESSDISQQPVYQEATKDMYIGDVHDAVLLSKLLPNPAGEALQYVDVSVPVYSSNQQLSGILAAHLSWEWSAEVEKSILAPLEKHLKDVEVFVVSNKEDTILLGPEGTAGERMRGEVLAEARSGGNSWLVESVGGDKEYLTGYAYGDGYMNYPGLGWSVIIRQPVEVALAPVSHLQRFIILAGLASAVLFGVAGWFLAGWIVRPLRNITRAADVLSSGGDMEIPSSSRFRDVAVLSASLHNLVNNLTQTETALGERSDNAYLDELTKLPNRSALEHYLAQAVKRAKQKQSTLSILYLDLDGFQKVNDTLGPAGGDLLLQEMARRLLLCTREHEIVARLGGDQFVVVLHTSAAKPMHEAEAVASRIISHINLPVDIHGQTVSVGCSVGAAVWSSQGHTIKETLQLADEALYISKRSGKNRITFEAAS